MHPTRLVLAFLNILVFLACAEDLSRPNLEPTGRMTFVSTRDNTPALPVQALYVMDADGSGQMRLTEDDSLVVDHPDWSPDGSRIVFIGRDFSTSYMADIRVVDADGSNMTMLLESDSLPARHAAWSSDGSRIAFSTVGGGIYVIDADGSSLKELTDGNLSDTEADEDPSWSPDGAKIAFGSNRDGQSQDIVVMQADGSNRINLTNSDDVESSPAWSPDGQRIAFVRGEDIWVMHPDGSNQVNLTDSSAKDRHPAWSPDGSKIVFTSDRDGPGQEIFVMRADGTDLIRLTQVDGGGNYSPSWTSRR